MVRGGAAHAGRRKWKVTWKSQDQAITWPDNKLSLNCKNASDLHLQGHELRMAGLAGQGLAPRQQPTGWGRAANSVSFGEIKGGRKTCLQSLFWYLWVLDGIFKCCGTCRSK